MALVRLVLLCTFLVAGCKGAATEQGGDERRIVTIGGALTEIVFGLGDGDEVVGVDTSSSHPPAVAGLQQVGSHHQVSSEGVLALAPTHVIASARVPATTLDQLRAAGVDVSVFEDVGSADEAVARIRAVARALGGSGGDALAAQVASGIEAARGAPGTGPRVMFIYARGASVLQVAGTDTPADAMIQLAGGVNAVRDFSGFKPLSSEAAVAAAPEVLLMMDSGAASLQGASGVFSLPGIALTPAGKARRLVTMDGLLLLGFGPRTPEAVAKLREALGQPEARSAR